ncbi:MAG: endonuclease Q family protein [Candidatus Diapherotrites archaeon]|nr:endonuclease Q family protein [Candidatus Diapherotrites archaeon]
MEEFNLDLHFHSPYAGGVSKNMSIPVLAEQAQLKGLDCISTADITQPDWLKHLNENLKEEKNGVYTFPGFETKFIVGTEIESANRIHHLVYLEDLTRAAELREKLKPWGKLDYYGAGRPKLKIPPEKLAEIVTDLGGLLGPAHAFTPYFGIYAHFKSIKEAYGAFGDKIKFLELGLSADSYYADLIEENHNYNFFSFSDAHSPWPHRLGREFIRASMKETTFKELEKTLNFEGDRKINLNVGLDPREGKYHETACNACYTHYTIKEAEALKWKCPCPGQIKKGVKDLILELADYKEEIHPKFRPDYLHIISLAEIIQLTLQKRTPEDKAVHALWRQFVDKFENEINVLVDAPIVELMELHDLIGKRIESFRKGFVVYTPGGGGDYGRPFICSDEHEFIEKKAELEAIGKVSAAKKKQKTLMDY